MSAWSILSVICKSCGPHAGWQHKIRGQMHAASATARLQRWNRQQTITAVNIRWGTKIHCHWFLVTRHPGHFHRPSAAASLAVHLNHRCVNPTAKTPSSSFLIVTFDHSHFPSAAGSVGMPSFSGCSSACILASSAASSASCSPSWSSFLAACSALTTCNRHTYQCKKLHCGCERSGFQVTYRRQRVLCAVTRAMRFVPGVRLHMSHGAEFPVSIRV